MKSNGLVTPPGVPSGIPDLSLVVPREKWIPVYHWPGCRGTAFYFIQMPGPGEALASRLIRMPDGTMPAHGSPVVCAACGEQVALTEQGKACLSIHKPPPNQVSARYRRNMKHRLGDEG